MSNHDQPERIGISVPWNAAWTAEDRHEVRPCKYAAGHLAIWAPYKPGEGKPMFAKPHPVRQRKSIAEMRCSVCGEVTPENDRWWFGRGHWQDGWWMTTESPVHRSCADHAKKACPVLRKSGDEPTRFPTGATVLSAMVGGQATDDDFGVKINGRNVVGHLKLAWRYDPRRKHMMEGHPCATIARRALHQTERGE